MAIPEISGIENNGERCDIKIGLYFLCESHVVICESEESLYATFMCVDKFYVKEAKCRHHLLPEFCLCELKLG